MSPALRDLVLMLAREAAAAIERGEFDEPRTLPDPPPEPPPVPADADAA